MKQIKRVRWALAIAALLLMSTPIPQAYTIKATKWNTSQVPFYVNTTNLDVDEAAALAAVQFGAYAWTNQTNAAFSFVYAGSTNGSSATQNGKNEIFFRDASNGSAIATTYTWSSGSRTIDTDIVFWDGGFTFVTGDSGCSGGMFIEDIATHEFGHALGLGHSTVGDATMYPSVGYCSINMRFLAEDDKQGAEYLYPSASTNSPPVATISSPTDGVVSAETVLTFAGSATDVQDGDIGANLVWTSNVDGQIGTGKSFQRGLSVGAHLITASITDSNGATTQAQRSLSVEATTTTPPSGGFQVTASPYKVKGMQRVDLAWTGTAAGMIDIYRNGSPLTTIPNTGRYSDAINKKGNGSYLYAVCEAGTSTCSNQVKAIF
jgi:hypothetical protein